MENTTKVSEIIKDCLSGLICGQRSISVGDFDLIGIAVQLRCIYLFILPFVGYLLMLIC